MGTKSDTGKTCTIPVNICSVLIKLKGFLWLVYWMAGPFEKAQSGMEIASSPLWEPYVVGRVDKLHSVVFRKIQRLLNANFLKYSWTRLWVLTEIYGYLCIVHTKLPITTINPCHHYPRPLVTPNSLNRSKHFKFQCCVLCSDHFNLELLLWGLLTHITI